MGLVTGFFLFAFSLAAQPEFTVSGLTAETGDTVDVNVVVDNYVDYISLQYSMRWDPAVVSFVAITNVTEGLPGFSAASSINVNAGEGFLTVSWLELSITPITLPDGTNVFTIKFEAVGKECDSTGVNIGDDPLAIEIADADEMVVEPIINNGYVSIPGNNCVSSSLRIIGSMETVAAGGDVCVKFTSEGFNNIAAAQFTMNFDPAVIDFTSIENINWPGVTQGGNFGISGAGNGEITFVWFDQNATGIDIADGTVLFEVCFKAIGNGGQMSQVTFGNDPRPIEFSDGDGNLVDFSSVSGKVNLEGEIEGFALIGTSEMQAAPGETVCMEVAINDFLDIVTLQFSINWDPAVLKYDGTQNYNLPDFSGGNVAGPEAPLNDPGQATVLWFDQSTQGITLDNGTSIFEICFLVVGDCDATTNVSFTSDPLPIEVSNETEVVTVSTVSGDFTAVCGTCDPSVTTIKNPSCPGDADGSIDIQVAGCPTPLTFAWSTGATTQNVSGLVAGEYSVTITTGTNDMIVLDMILLTDPDPLSVSTSITDVQSGGDGSIDITVTGGTSPYSYLWSNDETTEDISNLDPGEYSVTITDANGCVFMAGPYTVREEGAIGADVTNVACFGESTGAINITSVGCGAGPYTYLWSNGATTEDINDLAVGAYTVTVTSNDGGTCETSFMVNGPSSAIVITADTTNETGAGGNGRIELTVTGGEPGYDYIWSNGETTKDISGLTSGSYTVTVTDQLDCEVVETFVIRGKELFIEFIVSDYNGYGVSCFGECNGDVFADVSNAVGDLNYLWSTGETSAILGDLCGGSYSLTVTDELGQTAEGSVLLTEPEALDVEVDVTCASSSTSTDGSAIARVNGGVPPYAYEWSNGQTSTSITDQKAGPFVLFVTDDNNCENMHQSEICLVDVDCYEAITVITPNGDGKNDVFMIQCVFELSNRLVIYNRYGGKEFEMDNYDNSWMGTDNSGNELSDGGYHWVLEVHLDNGDLRVFNGTVSLLRSLD